MDVHSESNKIIQACLYGSIHYAMSTNGDLENPNLFKLAYNIESHINNVRHNVAKEYFNYYFKQLRESFHGCIRSIAQFLNPFLIKSTRYNEYLYVVIWVSYNNWTTTPADLRGKEYESVFTWAPGDMDNTGKFLLEYEYKHGRFWIQSGFYPERYLDTSHESHAHAPIIRSQLEKIAVRLLPSDKDNENCYIQNFESHHFIYAGDDDAKENSHRRTIFINGTRENRQSSYLWKFSVTEVKSTHRPFPRIG